MKHPYKETLKPFISEKLTECAKELGLTQEQISELLGSSSPSIANPQPALLQTLFLKKAPHLKNGTSFDVAVFQYFCMLFYAVAISYFPIYYEVSEMR